MLHIYSQKTHDSNTYIVGDVEGLNTLRDAIDKLLLTGKKIVTVKFNINNEKSFNLLVERVESNNVVKPEQMIPFDATKILIADIENII